MRDNLRNYINSEFNQADGEYFINGINKISVINYLIEFKNILLRSNNQLISGAENDYLNQYGNDIKIKRLKHKDIN